VREIPLLPKKSSSNNLWNILIREKRGGPGKTEVKKFLIKIFL